MARRAVQGYPEKSYYENTKFFGVLATNDPLNEGYFKHTVNFNISDTGMSVTPRKGFLTTTITNEQSFITLSDNTVIYKDNNTQQYIIYDLTYRKGYVVDISAYNVVNKFIPITKSIDNIDCDDVLEFLMLNHPYYISYYNLLLGQGKGEVTARNSTLDIINQDLQNLKVCSTPVSIIDINAVRKTVLKVSLPIPEEPKQFKFFLELYYRDEASGQYAENTLVLSATDTTQQPSVDSNERNLASYKSIIPEKKQIVYASNEAPDGFVNEFPIIYAETSNGYLLNTYQTPADIKIIPRFALEEAVDDSQWAYAYEIIKRKTTPIWDSPLDTTVSYRSPIFYLHDHQDAYTPFRISETLEQSDIDYELINKAPLIIVVPAEPNAPEYTASDAWEKSHEKIYLELYDRFSNGPEYNATTKLNELKALFQDVNTKEALIEAVQTIPNRYRFYLNTFENTYRGYDTTLGTLLSRDHLASDPLLTKLNFGEDTNSGTYIRNNYADGTIGKKELLEFLKDSNDSQFMFKFLPIAFHFTFYASAPTDAVYAQFPKKYTLDETNGIAAFYVYLAGNPFTVTSEDDTIKLVYESDSSNILVEKDYNINSFIELAYHEGYGREGSIFKKDSNGDLYTRFSPTIPVTEKCETCGGDGVIGNEPGSDVGIVCEVCGGTGYITTPSPGEYVFRKLNQQGFFTEGFTMIFYLISITPNTRYIPYTEFVERSLASTPFIQTLSLNKSVHPPTYITQMITKEPRDIQESVNYTTYNNERLVVWHNNTVYVSEAGDYFYFKEEAKHEFGERVVKVIQFKNILLVFTVQHLYAMFETELQATAEDSEGKTEVTSKIIWTSLPVLYNILTNEKYADAIQVFNQMVLFYSEDGQMFMIKPSTTIDSDTRFTLQYFNKSANDILLNYDEYINERLANYNIQERITKDQVQIKALLSVNFIKIFYYVPNLITYILIYDVINNRYTVYDTLSFTDIVDKLFIDSGELYLTRQDNKLYFSFPYTDIFKRDSITDMTITDNFRETAVSTLLDTGNINLNNHLNKRFLDFYVVFKNLSANKLLFNTEIVIDDVVSKPFYETRLEVKEIGGSSYFVPVAKADENDLIELINADYATNALTYALNNNLLDVSNTLMDFSDFNSNKLITRRASIRNVGKVIRLKMQFISKGAYKIQTFGIVFKERRV